MGKIRRYLLLYKLCNLVQHAEVGYGDLRIEKTEGYLLSDVWVSVYSELFVCVLWQEIRNPFLEEGYK